MKCPTCGCDTIVKDSRKSADGTWRRRHCLTCVVDITTMEQVCETVKGNRVRQPVDKPAVPKGAKVKRPVMPRKPKAPKVVALPKPKVVAVPGERQETTWERIERLREEHEHEKL